MLDDYGERVKKASDIEQLLFDLRVTKLHLMEQMKKEPTPQAIGTSMLAGVNLPCIEISTFPRNILNWKLFLEQFQAAVHDKPQLGGG